MRYIVFSLFLISIISYASDRFTGEECLKASYNSQIIHKAHLFGLIKGELSIEKEQCLLKVHYKEILKKSWSIDLCREPIHLKYEDKGNLSVFKKVEDCQEKSKSEFCQSVKRLKGIMQDAGLIFAEGAREKIDNDHGKVYCAYLLLNRYTEQGHIFSLYNEVPNIYEDGEKRCSVSEPNKNPPEVEEVASEPVMLPEPVKVEGTATESYEQPQF